MQSNSTQNKPLTIRLISQMFLFFGGAGWIGVILISVNYNTRVVVVSMIK